MATDRDSHLSVEQWLASAEVDSLGSRPVAVLGDGGRVSIQARPRAYCTPERIRGPHATLEVMLDGDSPAGWSEFREPDSHVHGWVPFELVDKYVKRRGGIVGPGTWC